MYCRRFRSTSGLYLLDIIITLSTLQVATTKNVCRHCPMYHTLKGKLALLANHYSSVRTTTALRSVWTKGNLTKRKH